MKTATDGRENGKAACNMELINSLLGAFSGLLTGIVDILTSLLGGLTGIFGA